MTQLQQALTHAYLVTVAIVAIVVLQCTGNLTTTVAGIVLAITGFSAVGVASITPSGTTTAPKVPNPAPAKPGPPGQ